jgi:hypothetical protein
MSNHPMEHKLAAYHFHINRIITLPNLEQCKLQEWKIIISIAKNKGFQLKMIQNLKGKIKYKTHTHTHTKQNYFYTNTK